LPHSCFGQFGSIAMVKYFDLDNSKYKINYCLYGDNLETTLVLTDNINFTSSAEYSTLTFIGNYDYELNGYTIRNCTIVN
jgi:hypothetical protein